MPTNKKKTGAINHYRVIQTEGYLGLEDLASPGSKPFYIDFLSAKNLFRIKHANRKNELLLKAVGKANHEVVDATAGLGRDSFLMASAGYKVIMLERSLVLHDLLGNALERAEKSAATSPIVQQITLVHADSRKWLEGRRFEVVYLDPMFPDSNKTALAKKEMQILQTLIGPDQDSEELLELALTCAANRVVVKRPRLAPPVGGKHPSFSMQGTSSRFDIYMV